MLLCGTQQTDVNSIEPPWYSWRVRSCPRVTRWVLRWVSVVDNHGARRNRLRQVEVHCPVATGTPAHHRRHKGGCPRARPTPSAKAAPCDRGRSWSAPRAGSQTLASRSISSQILKNAGIEPAPTRSEVTWTQFLPSQAAVACDFATVDTSCCAGPACCSSSRSAAEACTSSRGTGSELQCAFRAAFVS